MTDGRRSKLRQRAALALAVAGAAAATVVAVAGPGAAAQTSGTELHLTGSPQKHVGFFPKGEPGPGARLGFGDKLTGDDSGVSRGVCTIVGGSGGMPCTIWVKLSHGTLSLQGMAPEKSHNTPIAVTGGTGAYNGARGTAFITDASANKTKIVVDLLP